MSRGDRLNTRKGPSTSKRVVAKVPDGYVLRNLGCVQRSQRCCEVEAPGGDFTGWAAARFLTESGPPHVSNVSTPPRRPNPAGGVPELVARDSGEI
ncbi:SH3 domain-containing protein [Aliiruegeria haliotis]|uniref:SH3 domain-containing protein n=1 Tax=Aliiruegeria haliotis TaxID=1280846 RepID=UPI0011B2740C|nr:hypothetical protein [Aliiruegeria haliotis]